MQLLFRITHELQQHYSQHVSQFTTCGVGESFRDIPKQAEGSKGWLAPFPISCWLLLLAASFWRWQKQHRDEALPLSDTSASACAHCGHSQQVEYGECVLLAALMALLNQPDPISQVTVRAGQQPAFGHSAPAEARCGCETREILVPRGPYLTPRQTEGLLFCRNIPASSRTPWGRPSCQVPSSLDRGTDTAPITFGSGSGREQKAFCTARSGGPLKRYLSLQLSVFVISITLWVVLPFCPFPSQAGEVLHPRRELYLLKAAGG